MALQRICKNLDCNEWFEPKHDGAKFCCIKCKNRMNYINSSLEYFWEEAQITQRKKNRKILEYLYNGNKREFITRGMLEVMGFSFDVCFSPLYDDENNYYFRFGNTLLKLNNQEFEIKYIND